MNQVPYFSHEYRALHAYLDSIKRVNMRFTLTRLNRALWKLKGVVLPGGVFVQSVWGASAAVVYAQTPATGVNFLIHDTGEFVGLGKKMVPGSAVLMPPGSKSFTHTPGEYGSFAVSVPMELLPSFPSLSFLLDEDWNQARFVENNSTAPVLVNELLGDFFSGLDDASVDLSNKSFLLHFRDELFGLLGNSFGDAVSVTNRRRGRSLLADERTLAKAVDVVEHKRRQKVIMADLVQSVAVSETSLRNAFHRYTGLRPTEYIRLRKFNLIWQKLNSCREEDTTVARLVADCGIWDMGRFAKRYRSIFGENPSTTLRKE